MKPEIGLAQLIEWLLNQPAAAGENLFAVLDSAREASLPKRLQQSSAEFVSLYRGEPEESLANVAPYLVRVDRNSRVTSWLLGEGWGNSWGVFLVASGSLEDLRRHLRHFLMVRSQDGKELYFRFYDPRVLRVYLPTCTAPELTHFFGPVTSFLLES